MTGLNVNSVASDVHSYNRLDMFNIIKEVKRKYPFNIISMTEKEWTKILTEDFITMEVNQDTNSSQFRPCRSEQASPTTDWTLSWSLCRQPGLPPDMASFLWKMLHNLLGTQERLHRLGSSPSALCKYPPQDLSGMSF